MPATEVTLRVDDGTGAAVDLRRQDFAVAQTGAASQATLAAVLTALASKLEAGQAVALDAASLAALEQVTATIAGTVTVAGVVDLTAASLAALEQTTETGLAKDVTLTGGAVRVGGTVAVTGPLTDAQLRAVPIPISGAVTVSDGAGPLTVDGSVSVQNFPASQPVSGPLTDAQLRAVAVTVRSLPQFYASGAGGRSLFSFQTELISAALGATTSVAVLQNPAGSGVDIVLDAVDIGSSGAATIRRMLSTGATITGGTAMTQSNRGGGINASPAVAFASPAVAGGSPVLVDLKQVGASAPFAYRDDGSIYLRPGQEFQWTATPVSTVTAANVNVKCVYWAAPATI